MLFPISEQNVSHDEHDNLHVVLLTINQPVLQQLKTVDERFQEALEWKTPTWLLTYNEASAAHECWSAWRDCILYMAEVVSVRELIAEVAIMCPVEPVPSE